MEALLNIQAVTVLLGGGLFLLAVSRWIAGLRGRLKPPVPLVTLKKQVISNGCFFAFFSLMTVEKQFGTWEAVWVPVMLILPVIGIWMADSAQGGVGIRPGVLKFACRGCVIVTAHFLLIAVLTGNFRLYDLSMCLLLGVLFGGGLSFILGCFLVKDPVKPTNSDPPPSASPRGPCS